MRPLLLLPYYIHWHYGRAISSGFTIFQNFIWFIGHFFSIGILFKTLFQPWEKMVEERQPGLSFSNIASALLINLCIRFAGAVIRLAVIFTGFICMSVITVIGACVFIIWLAFPLFIIAFFGLGIVFLIKAI
ncbi:MAG: hypothetical protein V4519_03975 [Patescibacteria group bacterium]